MVDFELDLYFMIIYLCLKYESKYTYLFKIFRTETISRMYGRDGRTYVQTAVISYASALKLAGGGGGDGGEAGGDKKKRQQKQLVVYLYTGG